MFENTVQLVSTLFQVEKLTLLRQSVLYGHSQHTQAPFQDYCCNLLSGFLKTKLDRSKSSDFSSISKKLLPGILTLVWL